MLDKDSIINKIYNDPAGFGSMQTTLQDARKIDKTITSDDIKQWFHKNVERKTNLKGYNSFVASEPREEYQMDIMFFSDLKDPDYGLALLMVDIFTKFCVIIPLKINKVHDVAVAIENGIEKMGGKPKTIYSDNEGAFVSNEIQKYFKEKY